MAARLPHTQQALAKSAKLPGPGQYKNENMTGKPLVNSVFNNTNNYSISRDKRFGVPTKKADVVAPGSYSPLNNLNENFKSTFTRTG
jgi:hypothetical protein